VSNCLADNLDLSSERRSENTSMPNGSRQGEQSQGLPLDGELRRCGCQNGKRRGAALREGEAGDSFAVNKKTA
jgi:hypothetical protein